MPCSVQFTTVRPSTEAMPIVPRIATIARSDAAGGSFASQSGNAESSTSVTSIGSVSVESGALGASSAPVGRGGGVVAGAGSLSPRCATRVAAASAVPMQMSAMRCPSAARRSFASRSMRTECRSVPDVDDPLFGKKIECRGAAFAIAEARILHAPERHVRFAAHRRQVYVEHPRL